MRTQPCLAARLTRSFAPSPIDALIDLIGRCRLRCQIPVRLDLHTLARLRITVLPQRWPACRGDVRRLSVHADVIQNLPHLGPVGDKRDEIKVVVADLGFRGVDADNPSNEIIHRLARARPAVCIPSMRTFQATDGWCPFA